MPINLTKGQKVDLTKGNPGLKKIMVGLGWDVNAFDSLLLQKVFFPVLPLRAHG